MCKVLVFFVNVFINMVMNILFFFYVKIKKRKVLKVVINNVFFEWFFFECVLYILLSIFCFFVCIYRNGIRN